MWVSDFPLSRARERLTAQRLAVLGTISHDRLSLGLFECHRDTRDLQVLLVLGLLLYPVVDRLERHRRDFHREIDEFQYARSVVLDSVRCHLDRTFDRDIRRTCPSPETCSHPPRQPFVATNISVVMRSVCHDWASPSGASQSRGCTTSGNASASKYRRTDYKPRVVRSAMRRANARCESASASNSVASDWQYCAQS